jgi:hypothetical protein
MVAIAAIPITRNFRENDQPQFTFGHVSIGEHKENIAVIVKLPG